VKKYIIAWFAGIHWGYVMSHNIIDIGWTRNKKEALLFNKYHAAETMQQTLSKLHPTHKFEIEEIQVNKAIVK
jgi:hypothetical protein